MILTLEGMSWKKTDSSNKEKKTFMASPEVSKALY